MNASGVFWSPAPVSWAAVRCAAACVRSDWRDVSRLISADSSERRNTAEEEPQRWRRRSLEAPPHATHATGNPAHINIKSSQNNQFCWSAWKSCFKGIYNVWFVLRQDTTCKPSFFMHWAIVFRCRARTYFFRLVKEKHQKYKVKCLFYYAVDLV